MPQVLGFKPSIGRYRFTTSIDGDQYIFKVRWNSREDRGKGAWFFDVLEYDETPIVEGVKVVLGACMARWSNHPLFLNGILVCQSRKQGHPNPTFDSLGATEDVIYFNRGDLAAEMLGSISEPG